MSEKRKDNKGRLLRNGETQRKDGKYEYKYTDLRGERHSVYSWKLVDTDKLPAGKRECESLRSLEKKIERDLDEGVNEFDAKRTTLNDLSSIRLDNQKGLKKSTFLNIKQIYKKHVQDGIGNLKLADINYAVIKKFYTTLAESGYEISYIEVIQRVINPIFEYAVKCNYIRTNPIKGILGDLKKEYNWHRRKRYSLTKDEQTAFVDFIKNSNVYRRHYAMMITFLGTGCRIGELAGLKWSDIDFEERLIYVRHNLAHLQDEDGKYKYFLTNTKTVSGTRIIPMLEDVYCVLKDLKVVAEKNDADTPVIDGYNGFVFLTKNNTFINSTLVWNALRNIVKSYNKQETKNANQNNVPPLLLPKMSPHILRHTFCTRLCESGCNIKVIQEIMGHASINITMDVYADATKDFKVKSFKNIADKISIA
jgi:integrase